LLEPMSWESHVKTIENQLSPIGFPIKKKTLLLVISCHIRTSPAGRVYRIIFSFSQSWNLKRKPTEHPVISCWR
jgi:hypothetical protein